ncbi:hypothetical protein P152DRAFT_459178 [Eremomyces bilateralis CBS 781.70]|uniref:Mid2 domain-containing protein n=1 Tax=Eremomyces bilateralis CBS 781.70 TaxID=1392243 RepID=A0A6G1G1A8_9PEZI|nr:uncharacterized protein P152DRAFT_459178 [Eremomyces bilateralis CBS 781.70]KAF1811716.1 hypothetical protein P152DRAFT_459178 [Eremomyces bilateralis CBS 781.70]
MGSFINPPPTGPTSEFSQNPIYPVGTSQTVKWSTSWEYISLVLYQDSNSSFQYLPGSENITASQIRWTTSVDGLFDPLQGNVFFFAVFKSGSGRDYFGSHYFNITNDRVNPQGEPITSPTSTSSAASIPPTSSTFSTATTGGRETVTLAPTPAPSADSSSDTKVGVGVGLGVGILVVVAVGLVVWYFLRRHNQGNTCNNVSNPQAASWKCGDFAEDSNHPNPLQRQLFLSVPPQELST